MSSLHTHIILHTIFILSCTLIAFGLGGIIWALATSTFYLICWLSYHLRQIHLLQQHISQTPQTHNSTKNHTLWAHLLNDLNRKQRLYQRHRDLLRQTLIRFQAAAQALPNGIIMLNRDERIDWLNHTAFDHLKLNPQSALGSPIKKLFSQEQYQTLFSENRHNTSKPIQISLPQSNGIDRHLRLIRIPFAHQSQLIISEDISSAEQLNATRTAFIANVSHELRTPLTVIDGFLETLADYPELPSEQQQQFIGLMQHESRRMLNLINDLLTLSTLELENTGQKHLELQPLNLSELCEQITADARNLSGCQHTIEYNAPPAIMINAHARDLYQALSNLVFNAVRYTPAGGKIIISLNLKNHPNPYKPPQVRFAVRDNGVGIAAEHLPHITNRFYRVDKGRSRESGGTGLGLAIAKHALANHDAVLEIQSELGKGSEFAAVFNTLK